MKRIVYISAFVILGVLVQLLLHAFWEVWYIRLLLADFDTYGLGLSWEAWVKIHNILTAVLLVGGIWIGYSQGVYWWQKIYVEKIRWKTLSKQR